VNGVEIIGPVFSNSTFTELCEVVADARHGRNQHDPAFVRYEHHNLPPLVDVHRSLTEQASDLFGVRLKPSYVFLSNYLPGGRVPVHVDRPTCFRTIDLLVAQDDDVPWPIRISEMLTDDERVEVFGQPYDSDEIIARYDWCEVTIKPNEAVCYSGTHSWHYRPTEATARTDLIFFHFVEEGYRGSLD